MGADIMVAARSSGCCPFAGFALYHGLPKSVAYYWAKTLQLSVVGYFAKSDRVSEAKRGENSPLLTPLSVMCKMSMLSSRWQDGLR